jgi:glucose 1-dehydrogenase
MQSAPQFLSSRLKDRVAVVTGAAQGIGLAIAQRLAADGARVIFSDINIQLARCGARKSVNKGDVAAALYVDVRRLSSIRKLVRKTKALFGPIDILVNNAALQPIQDFFGVTESNWNNLMAVNLRGPFLCGQAVARQMKTRGGGVIINVVTTNSFTARPDMVPYAASKGGVTMLTRGMAVALSPLGIRVVEVAPGTTETPNSAGQLRNKSKVRELVERTPIGRIGTPEEVASVVAFLASDDASYMTGSTVFVEGGRMALSPTSKPLKHVKSTDLSRNRAAAP